MKKRYAILTLKILGGLVALLLVVLITAGLVLNSNSGQQWLLGMAVDLLQEKLETKVQIDSVSVNLRTFHINLMGLDVEDHQQRTMLQADKLEVRLDLMKLLKNEVRVESAELSGLRAFLDHPKDSAANYQFLLDTFKSDKTGIDTLQPNDKPKEKLVFNIRHLRISDVDVVHNGFTKKGFLKTTHLGLTELRLTERGGKQYVVIDTVHYATDNHQPRKNADRPKRGFFDMGHLDIKAHMELTINHLASDTVHVSLTKCTATDSITGIDVKDLRFDAGINGITAQLSNVVLQHLNTTLSFDSATVWLPSKKHGRTLAYQTSTITGTALLKDIARPFAPALHRFSIPLQFQVDLSGTDTTMHFRNIHVNTTDQRLKIDAIGDIDHLKEKEKLFISFNVKKMTTDATTAKNIIDQFVVKKFMMRQLANLGTIRYTGSFDILYKMEKFRGVLCTSPGNLTFNLTLNEKTKYLSGNVRTRGFQLGQAIEMQDINDLGCNASFTFDYSKARTAQVHRKKGGKLPIGKVTVSDATVKYKGFRFSNVSVDISSDGAEAQGQIIQRKKLADILCNFTFNNTDSIHKMRIKPGLRIHF